MRKDGGGRVGPGGLTGEAALLLACARGDRGAFAGQIEGVSDWETFRVLAETHGLLPLAARRLDREGTAIPAEVRQLLDGALEGNARASAFLLQESIRLAAIFAGGGIDAVSFKGPLFADEWYGDASLRPMGDLDFIIRREGLPEALALLAAEGYRPLFAVDPRRRKAYEKAYYAWSLRQDGSGIDLDLHWELARHFFPPAVAPLDMWGRTREVSFDNFTFRSLSAEDTLLLLCLHGMRHRWARLIWLVDVAEVVRGGLDWDLLLGLARRIRAERALLTGLALAVDLLALEVPPTLREMIDARPVVGRLAARVKADLFEEKARRSLQRALAKGMFQLRSLDTIGSRLRFLLLWVFAPNLNDWLWIALPAPVAGLYWFLRPFRLFLHYGQRLLQGRT